MTDFDPIFNLADVAIAYAATIGQRAFDMDASGNALTALRKAAVVYVDSIDDQERDRLREWTP